MPEAVPVLLSNAAPTRTPCRVCGRPAAAAAAHQLDSLQAFQDKLGPRADAIAAAAAPFLPLPAAAASRTPPGSPARRGLPGAVPAGGRSPGSGSGGETPQGKAGGPFFVSEAVPVLH